MDVTEYAFAMVATSRETRHNRKYQIKGISFYEHLTLRISRKCTERFLHLLVKPLRSMDISLSERILIATLTVFTASVTGLSPAGAKRLVECRRLYSDLLFKLILHEARVDNKREYSASRISHFHQLLSSITVGF